MKPLLIQELENVSNAFHRKNVTREFLQARILLSLQDHGAFTNWAFVGGTALRFLFRLPRYSEDLDFSLVRPGEDARFERLMSAVKSDLQAETYTVETKVRTEKTVAGAFIRFPGLLFELGLSPHRDENLSVRVEIDTQPPEGAGTVTRLIRRFTMLNLLHYDKASLFSRKLHAILSRKYTKGRDLYDLAWYLSDPQWPEPNLLLLRNALLQTGWDGPVPDETNWRQIVMEKLDTLDWKQALADVFPFLERSADTALISHKTIRSLLSGEEFKP